MMTFVVLVTFANSLDPDQAVQNVGSDLVPNCLTLMVFFEKKLIIFKIKSDDKKGKITQHAKELIQ